MNNEAVQTIEYKNHTINIFPDIDRENPIKEWDMLGEFICWHRNYDLGNSTRFDNPDEVKEYVKNTNSMLYSLYMYDHGGLALSLSPFSCPWDSGQLGYILVDRDKALAEFGSKKLTEKLKQKIHDIITGEVETYNQYLIGDVYGYTVEKGGEVLDSSWGFYGQDECINDAKENVDWEVKLSIKQHGQQVKQWIKNQVPLIYRRNLAYYQ